MRYLLSIILCLWAGTAWAFPPGFLGAISGGTPTPTPADYQWNLDDNAASRTLVAASGGNGSVTDTDTSVIHTGTGCLEGSGCFDLSLATNQTTRTNISIPLSAYNDNSLTFQVAFKHTHAIDQYTRLMSATSGTNVLMLQHVSGSTTDINLYWRGNNVGALTFPTLNDGNWHVIRITVDPSGTVTAYHGATEATLTSVDTITGITYGTGVGNDPTAIDVYGNSSSTQGYTYLDAKVDQIKIWTGVVAP
jgi:hypothetical protein